MNPILAHFLAFSGSLLAMSWSATQPRTPTPSRTALLPTSGEYSLPPRARMASVEPRSPAVTAQTFQASRWASLESYPTARNSASIELMMGSITKSVEGWVISITCVQQTQICQHGLMESGIVPSETLAVQEADLIAERGCWLNLDGTCSSVRPDDSVEKLAPAGVLGLSLRAVR